MTRPETDEREAWAVFQDSVVGVLMQCAAQDIATATRDAELATGRSWDDLSARGWTCKRIKYRVCDE